MSIGKWLNVIATSTLLIAMNVWVATTQPFMLILTLPFSLAVPYGWVVEGVSFP